MSDRRNRFLSLERPRDPSRPTAEAPLDEEPPRAAAPSGEPLEAAAPALDPAQSRLREARERSLKTDLALEASEAPGALPFLRCGVCEADNGRFSTRCQICGAALDTPDQQAFNQRLAAERHVQAELDAQEQARIVEVREAALSSERLQMHTEVAALERAQALTGSSGRSVGVRLLTLIPEPRLRFGVALALLCLGGFSLYRWLTFTGAGVDRWELVFLGLSGLFVPSWLWGWGLRPRWSNRNPW